MAPAPSTQESALRLGVFGLSAKEAARRVGHLLTKEPPTVTLWQSRDEIEVRIDPPAPGEEELFEKRRQEVLAALGEYCYGEAAPGLAGAVVAALAANGLRVATAESCTGGLVSQRITGVSGASAVFDYGVCTYAGIMKQKSIGVRPATLRTHGEVSSETAAEMAFGVAKAAGADIGLSVTGIAGPGGGTEQTPVGLVFVAACYKGRVWVKKTMLTQGDREAVRWHASQNALDMARRLALGLPIADARVFGKNEEASWENRGKPKQKNRLLRAVVLLAVLAALAGAGWVFRHELMALLPGQGLSIAAYGADLRENSDEYDNQVKALVSTMKEDVNPDICGWLFIPGAGVSYPVVQGQDNTYYQTHGYNGAPVASGAIYADAASHRTGRRGNLVLYGAGAKQLFGPLSKYKTLAGARECRQITYYTAGTVCRYDIMAVYYADSADGFAYAALQTGWTPEEFQEYIIQSKVRSLYMTPYDVGPEDALLTLVGPDNFSPTGHIVVLARLAQSDVLDFEAKDIQLATRSLCPPSYYKTVGGSAPDEGELYEEWRQWYLNQGTSNGGLQEAMPMPEEDAAVPDKVTKPPESELEAESEASSEQDPSSAPASVLLPDTPESTPPAAPSSSQETAVPPESEPAAPPSAPETPAEQPGAEMLTVTMNGVVTTGTAQDILSRIVAMEMSPHFQAEALKAQAVAAHTWILSMYAHGNGAPEVSGRAAAQNIQDAVAQVVNEVITYGGSIAFTPYCSMVATGTNASQDAWGGVRPYLVSVESRYDCTVPGYAVSVPFTATELQPLLAAEYGDAAPTLETDRSQWFTGLAKNGGGFVTSMYVGGAQTSGNRLREVVLLSPEGMQYLRSTAFDITYDEGTDTFTFTTYGWGHGVGMSQWGAQLYALNEGWSYRQILLHYYTGVDIVTR